MSILVANGCVFGDCQGVTVLVRGWLADRVTGEPLANVAVGGRSFTNGEVTDVIPALTIFGDSNGPPPDENGMFELPFRKTLVSCTVASSFPPPDQVEIIVVRDGCEQTFLIEINEDTVVDMDFPDDVIELKDPILVPPCDE